MNHKWGKLEFRPVTDTIKAYLVGCYYQQNSYHYAGDFLQIKIYNFSSIDSAVNFMELYGCTRQNLRWESTIWRWNIDWKHGI